MRRTVSVLSIVVGSVLTLLGLAAAVVIGPDDVAVPPTSTTASSDGARVALTAPDLFPYRNATVRVTARNAGGTVFVGVANPVDVTSYLTDVTRLWITDVGATGALSGGTRSGSLVAPPVPPESTTFWADSASGTGTRRLDVPLTGDPVSIAVVSGPTGGTLTMSVGVVVPHGFATAVATALLGGALLAAGVLLRRRGARTPESAANVETSTEPPLAGPVPTTVVWSRVARRYVGVRAAALGLAGSTVLTACAGLPQRVDTASVAPVRTAITDAEVLPAFASYDERNNAAIALSMQGYDPSGWETVDTGTPLRADIYSTLIAKAKGDTSDPYVRTTTPLQVFAPAFDSYPMWFMATATTTSTGTETNGGDTVELRVYERGSVLDTWRLVTDNTIAKDKAPRPLAGGRQSTATPAQRDAAVDAMEAVRTYATTGDAGTLGVDDSLAAYRANAIDVPSDIGTLTQHDVVPLGDPVDPTGPRGAVRVVQVEGGAVATMSFEYVHTVTANPGDLISLASEAVASVIGQEGDRDAITMHGVLTVAVLLPDAGAPTVLNSWWSTTTAP